MGQTRIQGWVSPAYHPKGGHIIEHLWRTKHDDDDRPALLIISDDGSVPEVMTKAEVRAMLEKMFLDMQIAGTSLKADEAFKSIAAKHDINL